jgi:hypothetical protein
MPRGSSLQHLRARLNAQRAGRRRDPQTIARIVIFVLLALNGVAAYFVMNPLGGSAQDLSAQQSALEAEITQKRIQLRRTKALVEKGSTAQTAGESFLDQYFVARRTAASTILGNITDTAKRVGIQPREHTIASDEIEGTSDFTTLTVTGNYEGNYGDLIQLVDAIDRSARLLVIEYVAASPQARTGNLAVQIRYKAFVREGS